MLIFPDDHFIQAQRFEEIFCHWKCGWYPSSSRQAAKAASCRLGYSENIEDMALPGYKLHHLKGALLGRWSITVNANWRMIFEFVDGNVYVLDYEDYH